MRLTVVGCSGSFPGPDGPASCYLLEADGFRVVLDLGSGALGVLQRHTDIYALDAVLLSHLHPDHCLDLCAYYVARAYSPHAGRLPRLPVYGPEGTAARLARAYAADPGVEADPDSLAGHFDIRTWAAGTTLRLGPLEITVARVRHPVAAYGLRIGHAGRVLAYSGDSDACPALVDLARGADLFLCEASFPDGVEHGPGVHLTGASAAEQARSAGARRLLLTHVPPWFDPEPILAAARRGYDGPVELARPGATYDVGVS